ncbi:MAG: DEAD/DEAH box helicase family protein [Candidatus Riflebacteria bacterium]|nr:DEAD/DEAH box helicase family protein [Candidatus Riflebacteria bacterium]
MGRNESQPLEAEHLVAQARNGTGRQAPSRHQRRALQALTAWHLRRWQARGGILVLPTGAGKTFVAGRFLCQDLLSQGYKIVWLAHTHHLLEQAFREIPRSFHLVDLSRERIRIRTVSGAPGHARVRRVGVDDDILLTTPQTLERALSHRHPSIRAFLRSAGSRLCVVFDEAHHAVAPTFFRLVGRLRRGCPGLALLGLTATPAPQGKGAGGRLRDVFPQGILLQVPLQDLIAEGILARPLFESVATGQPLPIGEAALRRLAMAYRELPPRIIARLAANKNRNRLIADTYARRRRRYGPTIIFADGIDQCEQISEFLRARGVRAAAVYSTCRARRGSDAALAGERRSEVSAAIEAFKRGELDVLVNVRLLTEGTDLPKARTVFLTRPTQSPILLTQMIGRALRGPAFGGTRTARIVSFIDDWQGLIAWAGFPQLEEGGSGPAPVGRRRRALPPAIVPVTLLQALARETDPGPGRPATPFREFLPVGWYPVGFHVAQHQGWEAVPHQRSVLVFDRDREGWQRILDAWSRADLRRLAGPAVALDRLLPIVEEAMARWFPEVAGRERRNGLQTDLVAVLRHMAQNGGVPPALVPFTGRLAHDLDGLVRRLRPAGKARAGEGRQLRAEFGRADRVWKHLFGSWAGFRRAFAERARRLGGAAPEQESVGGRPLPPAPPDFLPQAVRRELKASAGCCQCCGDSRPGCLEVDHVYPSYRARRDVRSNFQVLCRVCNGNKSDAYMDFRRSSLPGRRGPPREIRPMNGPHPQRAEETEAWEQVARRHVNFLYRCGAVDRVRVGDRRGLGRVWKVWLHAGNPPAWVRRLRGSLLDHFRELCEEAGRRPPRDLVVMGTPGRPTRRRG